MRPRVNPSHSWASGQKEAGRGPTGPRAASPRAAAGAAADGSWAPIKRCAARQIDDGPWAACFFSTEKKRAFFCFVFSETCLNRVFCPFFGQISFCFPIQFYPTKILFRKQKKEKEILVKSIKVYEFYSYFSAANS